MKLPKLGWVKFRWTRPPGGRIKHATVTRDPLGWHVSLCVELDRQPAGPNGGPPVGVDRGVAALVATSDGDLVEREFWTTGEHRRRRALEQRLARQTRGSRRRRRTVTRLATLRARVARRRGHELHTLSYRLATEHELVAVEKLPIRAMTRSARGTVDEPGTNVRQKAGLNREILERGWGELRRQLEYKTGWYGSELIAVPAPYTSQTCSACGVIDSESRESRPQQSSSGHSPSSSTTPPGDAGWQRVETSPLGGPRSAKAHGKGRQHDCPPSMPRIPAVHGGEHVNS